MIKVSDYIASFIISQGVKDVFMITGGGAMHLNDSIGTNPKLRYVCCHHEQSLAMAGEVYSRINGFAVVNVTTGPGGTNALTGVLGAWLDSIPMLVISGQVRTQVMGSKLGGLRQLGVQEMNIIEVASPMTKYAVVVSDPNLIAYHLEKAFYLAKSGRPGPVWLDIPLDIQAALIDENKLEHFELPRVAEFNQQLAKKQIEEVISLLKKAKRPLLIAGGGIRLADSKKELHLLLKKLQLPAVTAMSAHDLINSNHPLYAGRPGTFGDRPGNFAIQNCDLLISIGARLHLWFISYDYKNFAREAKQVVIDIDKNELSKPTLKPILKVHADAKFFLSELVNNLPHHNFPNWQEWTKYCQKLRKKYPVVLPEYKKQKKFVNSYYFTDTLSKLLSEDEVVVTANGTAFTGTLQCFNTKRHTRLISNIGAASMGYDLPGSIGAAIALPKKRIICIAGDGSIQMNLQELQTIVHHKLPIKIFVLSNDGYLAIRNTQDVYFKHRYIGADSAHGVSFPDMLKIAKAYGIPAIRIKRHQGLEQKIKKILALKGPVICDLVMNPNQPLIPKSISLITSEGKVIPKPLEDMYPFLPRQEFFENMLIKPIPEK